MQAKVPTLIAIRSMTDDDLPPLLGLNAAAAPAVAALDTRELERLMRLSDRHVVAAEGANPLGYALVFRNSDDYDGEEFLAFRSRLRGNPFLYIDQIVIRDDRRGGGLGRRLYAAIAQSAVDADVGFLCCEVNLAPPNPGSSAFHARMGFASVGTLRTLDGREVDLLAKRIEGAP